MEENLAIGAVAARAGLSVPTVRYYESAGCSRRRATPEINGAIRARYSAGWRSSPRAQRVGLSLDEIAADLATLPDGRTDADPSGLDPAVGLLAQAGGRAHR